MKTSVPDMASTLTNAVTAGMARIMAFPAGTDAKARLVSIGAGTAVIMAAENIVRVMAPAAGTVSRLQAMERKDMARIAEPTAVRGTEAAETKDMAVPGMAEVGTEAKSAAGGSAPPMRSHLGLGTKRRSGAALWTTSERVGLLTIQWSMPQMLK
jgi:hypothetical protein